jgi:hypothetical protein
MSPTISYYDCHMEVIDVIYFSVDFNFQDQHDAEKLALEYWPENAMEAEIVCPDFIFNINTESVV